MASVLEGEQLGGDALELGGPAVGGGLGERAAATNFDAPAATIFSIVTRDRRQPVGDHVGRVEVGTAPGHELRPGRRAASPSA